MTSSNSKLPQMPHSIYWTPSLEEYWDSKPEDDHSTAPGFPCFIVILYQTVSKGQTADDASSKILDNVLYIYPNNVQKHVQQALVGVLITFTTFSCLNLNSFLTSLSWSNSHIAVHRIALSDGNFLLFALKLPNFYTQNGVNRSLERFIRILGFISEPFNHRPLQISQLDEIKLVLNGHKGLYSKYLFPLKAKLADAFTYDTQPFYTYPYKNVLAIATGLISDFPNISDSYVGGAMFFANTILSSQFPHSFSIVLKYFSDLLTIFEESPTFHTFPIWITPKELKLNESESIENMTLGVIKYLVPKQIPKTDGKVEKDRLNQYQSPDKFLSIYILLKNNEQNESDLQKYHSILMNGIEDFIQEFANLPMRVSSSNRLALAYWKETGILKRSSDNTENTVLRMTNLYDEIDINPNVQEVMRYNGDSLASCLHMININVMTETETKNDLASQIGETYEKIKKFLPNIESV